MEHIDRKFKLPLSDEELMEQASADRINIETQPSAKLEDKESIDAVNENQKYPVPAATTEDDGAYSPVEIDEPVNSVGEEKEENTPSIEEEEIKTPTTLPQFQFRKLTTLPDGLMNMPSHAGEIEMLAQGQGIKGLAPSKGWIKAWKFLDTFEELSGSKYLAKGKAPNYQNINLSKIIASDGSTIQEYREDAWNEIRSTGGRPFFIGNELYAVNIGVTGDSVGVEKYDFSSTSWLSVIGEISLGADYIIDCCVIDGKIYVASTHYVWEEDGNNWSQYSSAFTDPITAITTDGFNPYVVTVSSGGEVKIYKVYPGSPDLIETLESSGYSGASLDYAPNAGYLFSGIVDSGTGKTTKVYQVGLNGGEDEVLSGSFDADLAPASASGSEQFDYLAVGNQLHRIEAASTLTQIYEATNEIGPISRMEEQIIMGGQLEVFHTEWEGTEDIQGATSGHDSKFGLGGGS